MPLLFSWIARYVNFQSIIGYTVQESDERASERQVWHNKFHVYGGTFLCCRPTMQEIIYNNPICLLDLK